MKYVRVRKLMDYQHPDLLQKSKGKPPWVRLYESFWEDYDLNEQQKPTTRILALRLLNIASRAGNCVPLDDKWLAHQASLTRPQVREGIARLMETGWIEEVENISRIARESLANGSRTTGESVATIDKRRGESDYGSSSTSWEDTSPDESNLSWEIEFNKILGVVRGSDNGTEAVLRKYATGLPISSLVKVRESSAGKPAGYATKALQSERKEKGIT